MKNAGVLSASAAGLAILLMLGTWQVFRLQEKTNLISFLNARIAAEPAGLAHVLFRDSKGEDVEYVKVTARGAFLAAPELRKLGSFMGSPGFQVLSPLLTDDNTVILVDRGAIPASATAEQLRPPSVEPAAYTGILRRHDKGQGYFDPENNPAQNQWYWWDVPAMLGAMPVPADARVSNYILQLLPEPGQQVPPIASEPKAELRNNHLGYALTWYGLAAALVGVTWAFLRKRTLEAQRTTG